MINLKAIRLPLLALALLAATAWRPDSPHSVPPEGLCRMAPGSTLALVHVEQDTTLPFAPADVRVRSMSGVGEGADTLFATAETMMPAGRVQLLRLDSGTRELLAEHGITDRQPSAFLRAAPYGADCRVLRWRDTIPFVQRGESGYVRGVLAPRDQWVDGVPVIVISDVWNYPYPRRRGLAFRADSNAPLAPAEAVFDFEATFTMPAADGIAADPVQPRRVMAWAEANADVAELEPLRTSIRRAVLDADRRAAAGMPSRVHGTYRVEIEVNGERATWFFRTNDRSRYPWEGADSLQTTADLLASPHAPGYSLVGYTAPLVDSLPDDRRTGPPTTPLVWLATDDRPTAPGNEERRVLTGELSFQLGAAPEPMWEALEALVPPDRRADSAEMARYNMPRDRQQPRIPLTVRLDGRSGVRADTTLSVGGQTLRTRLERLDSGCSEQPCENPPRR